MRTVASYSSETDDLVKINPVTRILSSERCMGRAYHHKAVGDGIKSLVTKECAYTGEHFLFKFHGIMFLCIIIRCW